MSGTTIMLAGRLVPGATRIPMVATDRYLAEVCRANVAEARAEQLQAQVETLLRRLGEWPAEALPF
jgi:predicted RNA methylase